MFRYFVIGILLSLVASFQLSDWPSLSQIGLAVFVSLSVLWLFAKARLLAPSSPFFQTIIGFLFGFGWLFLHVYLTPTLPNAALLKEVTVEGEIVGLPKAVHNASRNPNNPTQTLRFQMRVNQVKYTEKEAKNHQAWWFLRPKIDLNWYQVPSDEKTLPRVGETWRFNVKLKPPHGSLNPGGFDYEAYLYEQSVRAKGYVRTKQVQPEQLAPADVSSLLAQLRADLAQSVTPLVSDSPFNGIFRALWYGDRSDISAQDWQTLQQTGTIHLMAISGLHVGLMAGIGYWLLAQLWNLGIRLSMRLSFSNRFVSSFFHAWKRKPRVYFAASGALLFATLYMALAGFAIPTQRAWIMVLAVLVFIVIRRSFQPWSALALAAFLIVLWHPASVLSQGFWLSFLAVAIIFAVLAIPSVKTAPNWQKLLWIQLALTIGLAPILLWYYQQVASASLLANLVAVPFVTLIGLPLLFVTLLVSFVSMPLAQDLMWLNNELWSALWWMLQWLQVELPFWQWGGISIGQVIGAYGLAVAVWWAWQSRPRYQIVWMALFSMALLWAFHPKIHTLKTGEAWVTVLDVGQGQAVVFETHNEVVVYDTGAKWGEKMDGAKLALLPYFRSRGIHDIDLLIVSHSDSDHAGGVVSLWQGTEVKQAVSGEPEKLNSLLKTGLKKEVEKRSKKAFLPCKNHQAWWFSGLKFEFLQPVWHSNQTVSDNDRSCILRVSDARTDLGYVLIPGDASQKVEAKLLARQENLQAQLLMAGHHGSNSSSSTDFLQAVQAKEAVISAGFLNRFQLPSRAVLERIHSQAMSWRNTAAEGAIRYKITPEHGVQYVSSQRRLRSRWFHTNCETFSTKCSPNQPNIKESQSQ